MAVTELGKFLRKIRIDLEENLKDMADKLGVAASYLSSIESGKRNVPSTLAANLVKAYNLSVNKSLELDNILQRSLPIYEVKNDGNPKLQQVLIKMANKEVSAGQYEKILELLNSKDSKGGI